MLPTIKRFLVTFGLITVYIYTAAAFTLAGCTGNSAESTASAESADSGDPGAGTEDSSSVDAGQQDVQQPQDTNSGPQPPKPYKYTGGKCPKMHAGHNKLFSWNTDRTVDIYLPGKLSNPGLLFAWHGLGGKKESFGKVFGASLANSMNVIVAVPQSKGSVTGWGWTSDKTALNDSALFDDLLTCIDEQWDIDNHRVMTTGFSAGALWSSYLVIKRSTFLAAALIWSGGTGPKAYVYHRPKRKIPVLLAWGGEKDNAFLSFHDTTSDMASRLRKDGHVVITCNHGGGHTIPMADGALVWGRKFLDAHRWDTLANSPFAKGDLGAFPQYCSLK